MNKKCTGTLYEVGGKTFCVGERKIKKINGKTVDIRKKKSLKKIKIKRKSKNNKTKKHY